MVWLGMGDDLQESDARYSDQSSDKNKALEQHTKVSPNVIGGD